MVKIHQGHITIKNLYIPNKMQKANTDRSMRRNNELYKYSGRFKQASFNTVENMMEKST